MSGKRPLDVGDGATGDAKRIRSNNGSPAPAPQPAASQNGETDLQRKKREAAEKMAAIKARLAMGKAGAGPASSGPPATATPPPPPPATNGATNDLGAKKAEAQRKIQEMKARMAAKRGETQPGAKSSPVNGGVGAGPSQPSEKEARIAEARARAAELAKQKSTAAASALAPPPPRQDGRTAKGGMGVGLHPLLMENTGPTAPSRGKAAQGPKFSTTKGNQQLDRPKANPYLPAGEDGEQQAPQFDAAIYDPTIAVRKGGERKSKQLVFNQKGKFMAQANALRQQARLEDMKRRIAAETRKVEIEEASDKSFLVPAPPEVEWWDEGLLPESQNSYTDCLDPDRNKISVEDSIITALIQHPVQLAPPQDRFIPAPKPLMLTQQEQKKLRRQRRMADMKEEQAKIRLGLIEPPAPKVKKNNMMRVLGEQAVKDPTAVEARVNKEIAQRASEHVRANEARALTKEQREEKLKAQQAADEAKGVKVAVFRVDDLSSGKHRYQVDQNAKQHALTGMVVLHPAMNLVIVEGGSHSISAYKKLMLNRVKWAENTMPLDNTNPTTFTGSGAPPAAAAASTSANATALASGGPAGSKHASWCTPFTDEGALKDLSENRCVLVWEGEQGARSFKRWGSRAVETDGEARDVLGRQKMENMWTLARSK
ncbi:U4/U5/U6 small nuclear ribonucleoprotein prp3 [Extremus antarcticus]|uniref:U4/U5/U6 small nuclear ribonucleoprotein prp3 n=1 Tax=Extremus antarcticus TaxID=702011 RepID=A0AAJ0GIH8_9PEZI|nr:U4/U5/U6 small nuclear ribonucleoprotein prp3 [Extremus antarcticus]